jgi:hypothetical protein
MPTPLTSQRRRFTALGVGQAGDEVGLCAGAGGRDHLRAAGGGELHVQRGGGHLHQQFPGLRARKVHLGHGRGRGDGLERDSAHDSTFDK